MSKRGYKYQPKQVEEIVIRAFAFDFPDDLDPIWVPANPVNKLDKEPAWLDQVGLSR